MGTAKNVAGSTSEQCSLRSDWIFSQSLSPPFIHGYSGGHSAPRRRFLSQHCGRITQNFLDTSVEYTRKRGLAETARWHCECDQNERYSKLHRRGTARRVPSQCSRWTPARAVQVIHFYSPLGEIRLWMCLNPLSSAKRKLVAMRPPSPGDIHDVTRRARNPSPHGTRRAICVCGRCSERCPGWVPGIQGRVKSEACRDCNGLPTPW